MIAKHKRTGDLYRMLIRSFSTERQRASMVYLKIDTGQIFDRDEQAFFENFELLNDAQSEIMPRDTNQTEMDLAQQPVAENADGTKDFLAQQIR